MDRKRKYVAPVAIVELFEEVDLITESPSSYDGVGYIPNEWYNGWLA
ncbi:MAG: hypothetical protein IKC37_01200 [Clostridia bacterium]|nr:hypothetical protein [Clostridia bacterium]